MFLITDINFEEFITMIEAAIGTIYTHLYDYVKDTEVNDQVQNEKLNKDSDIEKLKLLFKKFKDCGTATRLTSDDPYNKKCTRQ